MSVRIGREGKGGVPRTETRGGLLTHRVAQPPWTRPRARRLPLQGPQTTALGILQGPSPQHSLGPVTQNASDPQDSPHSDPFRPHHPQMCQVQSPPHPSKPVTQLFVREAPSPGNPPGLFILTSHRPCLSDIPQAHLSQHLSGPLTLTFLRASLTNIPRAPLTPTSLGPFLFFSFLVLRGYS